jgi:hypothetical protein
VQVASAALLGADRVDLDADALAEQLERLDELEPRCA